jgi:hypothetical protein
MGHCKRCGKAVELLPDGSCPRGHGTSEIAYAWDAGPGQSLVKRWGLPAVVVVAVGWVLFAAAAVFILTTSRDIQPKPSSGLELGKGATTSRWRYTPLEATRTATIKDSLGEDVSAGQGYDFLLVRMSVKNVSRVAEHIGWDFDDQPVLEWRTSPKSRQQPQQGGEREGALERFLNALGRGSLEEETYYFEEYEGYSDIGPGTTEIAWLVFRVPARKRGFTLKIEGNTWSLGL